MHLSYLGTLPLGADWYQELARRCPEAVITYLDVSATEPGPALLAGAHLLHTTSYFPAPDAVPALRCVQLDTSGIDHVRDTPLWRAASVPFTTLGGLAPIPMAEFAMMSVLELAHRMPRIVAAREDREWPGHMTRLREFTPAALTGARMTIVGYGRIGREIARLGRAFGMEVTGVRRGTTPDGRERFDTGRQPADADPTETVPVSNLGDALARTDFLIVVVPLTEQTAGLLGETMLDRLPSGAYVVNIARGGIVNEQALRQRLEDGRIAGAVLDVFDEEPLSRASPWWSDDKVLMTPHVAGLTPYYREQTMDLVIANLERLREGRPLLNEVDRVTGY